MKGRVTGIERDIEARHNMNAWLGIHIENMRRHKKLPPVTRFLYRKRPKPQTPDQMLSMIRTMNAAFGGKDLTQG